MLLSFVSSLSCAFNVYVLHWCNITLSTQASIIQSDFFFSGFLVTSWGSSSLNFSTLFLIWLLLVFKHKFPLANESYQLILQSPPSILVLLKTIKLQSLTPCQRPSPHPQLLGMVVQNYLFHWREGIGGIPSWQKLELHFI